MEQMMLSRMRIGAAALMILFWSSFAASAGSLALTDISGRPVTVPENPQRIVALGPGALRLIVYLDAADKVAAVESMEKRSPKGRPYWIAQPELHRLPECGPGGPAAINKKPDMEALLRARPQIIFVTYMDADLADEIQRTLGIPVVGLTYGTLGAFDTAIYESLRIAGRALDRSERAEAVVARIEALRSDLRERTREIPAEQRVRAYAGAIGHRGAHGIESTELEYIPLDGINAVNLAHQVKSRIGDHLFADKEILLGLDPDVIFIDGGGLALVAADYRKKPEYYHALTAFKTGRVYSLLPFNFYSTNIGTALADAYAAGKILYPDRFADIDAEKKADEIYAFLVGKPVYAEMARDYGVIGGKPSFLNP